MHGGHIVVLDNRSACGRDRLASATMEPAKPLIVGYRPEIAKRLYRRGLEFAVWHDRRIKKATIPGCSRVIDSEPFASQIPKLKKQISRLFGPEARFTHVIAGTESSVVAASVARRILGGRKSKDTVVLRCHNKRLMKEFFRDKGIPLIPFLYSGGRDKLHSAAEVVRQLGLPVVVKPLDSSGGRGLVFAHCATDLEPFLKRRVLFEKFVDAPELSVESFIYERQVRFVSTTQYVEKRSVNLVPSGHPDKLNAKVIELNRQVLNALDIRWGITHAEYYLADDQIYFGEIAVRPPGGYIMDLISLAHNFDAWKAFVDNELGLEPTFGQQVQWAAATLFHPGGGIIESVSGQDSIKSHPLCKKLYLHSRPGDRLGQREGAGEIAAYALFCGATKTATIEAVRQAQRKMVFRVSKL